MDLESRVADPSPTNPLIDVPVDVVAVTGAFDMGDAQVDKTVTGFNYAIGSDRPTTVYTSCIAVPSDSGTAQVQADFIDTITPPGDLLDSTFVAGTS
ncbi:MAG: hypothetical protein ACRDQZ_10945 [Mycobacteriales bacterium]